MILFPALPVCNRNIAAVFVQKAFSDEECEQIRASCDDGGGEEGMIGGYGPPGQFAVAPDKRHVRQQRLPADKSGYPLSRLCLGISNANAEFWSFDLTGFVADDPPWVMKYAAERRDHYDWHIDVGQSVNASRKLAFSLQLSASSDYEGGDLEFFNLALDRAQARQRGAIIVFPAFRAHRVTPVTAGVRWAVVGWVHGPTFR
jgi:predicted 2-oxoglutarate/Fe(II)-dependent dioxygenase YbiX